ncbi:hypothetical protein HDU67_001827 [Dinochytrium kinnereticum]|nr:hypothetical protein HDU67_001827 [Dinochytrium kinnereticum]
MTLSVKRGKANQDGGKKGPFACFMRVTSGTQQPLLLAQVGFINFAILRFYDLGLFAKGAFGFLIHMINPSHLAAAAVTIGIGGLAYHGLRTGFDAAVKALTALPDLAGEKGLGSPCVWEKKKAAKAVVVGGSWAGLLAARALLDHVDTVTIIEAEDFGGDQQVIASTVLHRSRVMQFEMSHALLALGLKIAEKLVPGFTERLLSLGGVPLDFSHANFYTFGGKVGNLSSSSVNSISASRSLYENALRIELLQQHGVSGSGRIEYLDNSHMKELILSEDGKKCEGVRYTSGRVKGENIIHAGIFVDASGRRSEGLRLLTGCGVEGVKVDRYDPLLSYASVQFEDIVEDRVEGSSPFECLLADPVLNPYRIITCQRIEGNKILLGAMTNGSRATLIPKNIDEMRDFVEATAGFDKNFQKFFMPTGDQTRTIKAVKTPPSHFVNYQKFKGLPEGYFAVGDAICAVNPIYGQGLTTAAVSVSTMDSALRSSKTLTKSMTLYFNLVTTRLTLFWMIPFCQDIQYNEVEPYPNAPLMLAGIMSWVVKSLSKAAHKNQDMVNVFWRTLNYVIWPQELASPSVVFAMLKAHFWGK